MFNGGLGYNKKPGIISGFKKYAIVLYALNRI